MAGIYGANKDEFVTSLTALILYDGEAEVSSDNISALLSASNNTVAPYWPALFSGFLNGGRIEKLVLSGGVSAGAAPTAAGAAAVAAPAGGDAPAKKEEKPKEEVVDALDGGMDMFGGGGGGGDY